MVRVALYARVSTRDRDQDPELQLVPLREYAEARGWVAMDYVDRARAGDLVGRVAWHQLLEDCRRRRCDRVLVWKLDRGFRSTLHALRTLEALEAWGVGFACLTQDLDTTTPTGRLVFTVLAAVAEMERELIADRVREGMAHARRQGTRLGRPSALERPGFRERWARVAAELAAGRCSRRQAARRLGVGQATIGRLLAGDPKGRPPEAASGGVHAPGAPARPET